MHVTLVMICKNEEAIIKRALESAKPHVHSWIVADNGSTDRTCEIVEETMKDLPGKLIRTDWKGFAANRNECFREAEKWFAESGIDDQQYLFMLDCDDMLKVEPGFEWPSKKPLSDGYRLRVDHGSTSQGRAHLFKGGIGWIHQSGVHEYSELPGGGSVDDLENCSYVSGTGGARAADPQRWKKDIKLLLHELKKKPNDPRCTFYLARSYFCDGQLELALKTFERRMKQEGWFEERWYASLDRFRVGIAMNAPRERLMMYALESYAMLPSRAEPMYEMAKWLRLNGDFIKQAYPFALVAAKTPRPSHNGLFIDEDVYRWKALDEMAVSSYWVGQFKDALEANERILQVIPEHETATIARVRDNVEHCKRALGI